MNEAARKFARQSEWLRPWIELGPAVADQSDYELPARVARVLKLEVDDVPWAPGSQEMADRVLNNELFLRTPVNGGIFFSVESEDGTDVVESVRLYSVSFMPAAGVTIQAKIVRYPETLTSATLDTWTTPWDDEFDRGILDYVRMLGVGEGEDSQADRTFYADRFAESVIDAKRLRNSKMGRGPRQLAIKGKTT